MIRHFFLDKTNTIIENSTQNTGLNPILTISYGNGLMRGLIHFNMDDIKSLIDDKTFANIEKLHFTLKMTNCFSVAGAPFNIDGKKRATSFDLMLFKLPCNFDAGRGFDYINDFWVSDKKNLSTDGSSWYSSKTKVPWIEHDKEYNQEEDKGGIYSMERLLEEYNKYINNEETIIVGLQHFDFGYENLSIDITKYVLDSLKSGDNFGLGLSFTPKYEMTFTEEPNFVSFFTDNTNTFFHPYVEVEYKEYIIDRRNCYTKNTNDKLYLYVVNDGLFENLDNIPSCSINDCDVEVKQASKGVYYAQISNKNMELMEDVIYYDRWSNLSINGELFDDIEMEFYVNKRSHRMRIGNMVKVNKNLHPNIYGINDGEELNREEIRCVIVDIVEKYISETNNITSAKYRLYVKDGDREIDVINYHPIELSSDGNFFNIYTMDLIPNEYFVDIQISYGNEIKTFKKILRFSIINNITERYQ